MQTIKLGNFIINNIEDINNNFAEIQLNKADKKDIPTKNSALENDAGYQTLTQVKAQIDALVSSAPEALDTLKELATALGEDPNFAATITNELAKKVDKEQGKGLSSEDFTAADKSKLAGLKNYTLPIAGDTLGGIKNGGNVVIASDGTANVALPEAGTSAVQVPITLAGNWAQDESIASGYWFFRAPLAGLQQKNPVSVYRKNGTKYEQIIAMVAVEQDTAIIGSLDKFEGYFVAV